MKLVLISMIRNESKIIKRCLEAVQNIVDCFCICDTGSADNTVEIVNEFLKEKVGCLTTAEWKNFGHNRTISFENAQAYVRDVLKWNLTETYGLLLDADMVFVPGTLKSENLDKIGYSIIQKNNALEYYNARLIRMDYPWKCVGVTHEYWDGKTEKLPKSVCYIDDKEDGGCKADKYERDKKLLEEGLEKDPTNVRYMFYLAQTLKCMRQFEAAIEVYKRRIQAGGWAEEIWNSFYSIGMCYFELKRITEFEDWMQRAYVYRPVRAESIHKLCKTYRISGEHYKAYHYLQLGRKIPYPKDDVLFIETSVYTGDFDYEASILEYYVHNERKTIGLKESINYLLKRRDLHSNVMSNMKFYIEPIGEKFEKLNIPEVFGPDFHPSAISIYEYPLANVRFVNYLPPLDGTYKSRTGGPIETRNAYINLETMQCVSAMNEPEYPLESKVKGLEDLRLYKNNDKLCFTATSHWQFVSDKISLVQGEYDYENKQLANCVAINSPTSSRCEKNWVNIPGTDSFIYGWSPLRVGKIVNDRFIYFVEHQTNPFFEHMRGSAPPIRVDNKWWTLVHFVEYSTPRKYYHCFIELDENFKPTRMTLPFYFKTNSIEYCISCLKNGDTLDFYTSFMDSDPHKVTVSINKLVWISV